MAAALSARCRPCPAAAAAQRPRAPSSSSAFVGSSLPRVHLRAQARRAPRQVTRMGLFGLGVPELAVIAGVVALIYGATLPWRGLDPHCVRPTAGVAPSRWAAAATLVLPSAPTGPAAGPSKLPEIGKGLGKTVKSFQSAAKEFEKELKEAAAPDEEGGAAPPPPPPKQ